MRNFRLYISDILDCIARIEGFVEKMDYDTFLKKTI